MKIQLQGLGKRYNNEWIFRNINTEILPGEKVVILGSNGSGKSTLLRVVAGNFLPSEGKTVYSFKETEVDSEEMYKHISVSAPYLEIIEEFTFKELIDFYSQFKPMKFSSSEIIEISGLKKTGDKAIKHFSSGMKQRVKLVLAALSDVPLLLLDEPSSNLDKAGIAWYRTLIEEHCTNKTIIVCSNAQQEEYFFCSREIKVEDYKPVVKRNI
jgi:ABC-type multidrug transport system ATPase subunit